MFSHSKLRKIKFTPTLLRFLYIVLNTFPVGATNSFKISVGMYVVGICVDKLTEVLNYFHPSLKFLTPYTVVSFVYIYIP